MNLKKRNFTILFLFFSFIVYIFPEDHINFDHISIKDGLSQVSVYSIIQDSQGFIWIATEDGLNKFDGYEFKTFKPDQIDKFSISHNYIWELLEDSSGKIWIGTNGGGLNRFDPVTQNFIHFKSEINNSKSLSNNFIRKIYEDRAGVIWVGTEGGGLNKVVWPDDKGSGPVFVRFLRNSNESKRISSDFVRAVFEDNEGDLWIGTGNGLDRLKKGSNKIDYYKHDPLNSNSLSNNDIREIYQDKEGILWIGTNNGLNRFDRSTGSFEQTFFGKNNYPGSAENGIRVIQEDNSGNLWIGTDKGLRVLKKDRGKFFHYEKSNEEGSLSNNEIRSLLIDRSGIMWIGTEGGGICRFSPLKQKFRSYKRELKNYKDFNTRMIWSVLEDSTGIIWLGTNGGGLARLDRKSGDLKFYKNKIRTPNVLSGNIVKTIYEDREGILWIGTETGGLNRFDTSTGKFLHFKNDPDNSESLSNNHIRKIIEGSDGYLWLGTNGGGLNRFDRKSGKFRRYMNDPDNPSSISFNDVYTLVEDSRKILWAGTWGGGLNKFLRDEEKFIRYRHDPEDPFSLSHNLVLSFCEDKKGNFWIGTSGGGLNRFEMEKEIFIRYGEKEGLTNGVVYGILDDENGNLWLSTNSGIFRFDPRTNQFKNYSEEDGLQSNEFNGNSCFKNKKTGKMFFGGVEGFNSFLPDEIRGNKFIPPVVITSFLKFNKRIKLEKHISRIKEIRLSYKDYFFSFEFSALDFTMPKKNLYAYKLDGLDNVWIYTDSNKRLASYTTLSPGKYTLRIKGTNSDGLWNEKGAAIDIIITPPFWKTFWFKVLILFLLIMASFAVHRIRMRRLEKELKSETEMERLFLKKGISVREREIIILILNGKTSREIEDKLFISYGTVKNHIYSIYKKLNIKNRAELLNLFKEINSNKL